MRAPARWACSLAAALLTGGCAGVREPAPDPPCAALRMESPGAATGVILIVNDTMRRDYLGVYGGQVATPVFDAFARRHFWFDQAYSNAPWTKPSIATLFTSTYPSQHDIASHPELRVRFRQRGGDVTIPEADVVDSAYTTLAEMLQQAGFRTAAFVGNPWMGRDFGFAQGFEVYDDSFAGWDADGLELSRAALSWVEALAPGERFFLYLHYVDSHLPYGALNDDDVWSNLRPLSKGLPPESGEARDIFDWLVHHEQQRFSPKTVAQLEWLGPSVALIEMAYRRGIEDFDRNLGVLLEGLERQRAWPDTAIFVTADHGEAMFQRDYGSHGMGLYDDELAIPFAAKLPGVRGTAGRVECTVELIDVMPTLAAYLGIAPPTHVFGRDFLGSGAERFGVSEGVMFKSRNRTLRTRSYKLLWEPDGPVLDGGAEYSLFDVARDPRETRDLLSEQYKTPDSERVAQQLIAVVGTAVPEFAAPTPPLAPVDPALEERLRSLGYLK